jgi:hypothetical protein
MTPPNFFVDKTTGWLRAGWGLDLPLDEYVQLPAHLFGFREQPKTTRRPSPRRPVAA